MLADLDDEARERAAQGAHRLRAPPRRRASGRVAGGLTNIRQPDTFASRRSECLGRHPPRPRPAPTSTARRCWACRTCRSPTPACRRCTTCRWRCPERAVVGVLGNNGAGKTTLLRAISGTLAAHRGAVTGGAVELAGARLLGRDSADVARAGVVQVPEGRRIFSQPDGRGEPPRRRARRARQGGARAGARLGPRAVPDPRRARPPARRAAVGRRAADARDRPGADGRPARAAARRAVARPGAARSSSRSAR